MSVEAETIRSAIAAALDVAGAHPRARAALAAAMAVIDAAKRDHDWIGPSVERAVTAAITVLAGVE